MVTITSIGFKAGYTGEDHLLDDGPLQNLIGRDFDDAGEAKAAANDAISGVKVTAPIWIKLEVCGEDVEIEA